MGILPILSLHFEMSIYVNLFMLVENIIIMYYSNFFLSIKVMFIYLCVIKMTLKNSLVFSFFSLVFFFFYTF